MAEVRGSTWIAKEEKRNRVQFPKSNFSTLRHFIVMFHDSTFECLAVDFELIVSSKPRDAIIKEYLDEIY